MAFEALIPEERIEELHDEVAIILAKECVAAADPGLAMAFLPAHDERGREIEGQIEKLIAFGKRTKQEYCTKASAYELAQSIPWLSLTEHGGDGQGVVGALAGIGLRLSGSDGRFRGKINLSGLIGKGGGDGSGNGGGKRRIRDAQRTHSTHCGSEEGAFKPARTIAARLVSKVNGPVSLVDETGASLASDTLVLCDKGTKAVFLRGSLTIVCHMEDGRAFPLEKDQLEEAGNDEVHFGSCNRFEWDNDLEECSGKTRSCRNCLHRRWESVGFSCMIEPS